MVLNCGYIVFRNKLWLSKFFFVMDLPLVMRFFIMLFVSPTEIIIELIVPYLIKGISLIFLISYLSPTESLLNLPSRIDPEGVYSCYLSIYLAVSVSAFRLPQ